MAPRLPRRATRLWSAALLLATTGLVTWADLAPASAQQVTPAVQDLRTHDVTFEEGALSSSELADLDSAVARLQDDDAYFKVVALGDPVSDFSNARAFADQVRSGLGGRGTVTVFSPDEVGVSTNVEPSRVSQAETAAADEINVGGSWAQAATVTARQLGYEQDSGPSDDGMFGSGVPWLFLLFILVIPLAILFFMWRAARRMQQGARTASAAEIGAAEATVRASVDKVANDLLDLSDRVDQPDAPAEAKAAFSQGAELFTATQEQLEQADTRPELTKAYAQVVEAGWLLDVARARLDGQPEPARPEVPALFPEPAVAAASGLADDRAAGAPSTARADGSVAAAEPHYLQAGMSPWLTSAAVAALSMLSQRGMSVPRTRQPMDDGMFGSWMQDLPGPSTRSRSRSRSGSSVGRSSGRGFGRRGGSVVRPSGAPTERGMGRR